MVNLFFLAITLFIYIFQVVILKNYIISLSFPLILGISLILINEFINFRLKNNKSENYKLYNYLLFVANKIKNNELNLISCEEEFNKRDILKEKTDFRINNIDYLKYLNTKINNKYINMFINVVSNNSEIDILLFDLEAELLRIITIHSNYFKNLKDEILKSSLVFILIEFFFFIFILILNNLNLTIFNEKYIVLVINVPVILFILYLFSYLFRGSKNEKVKIN